MRSIDWPRLEHPTRLLQECLLLACLTFGFFVWPIVGVLAGFIFMGERVLALPLLVLLTLPAWPLWAVHAVGQATTGATPFDGQAPLMQLNLLCALLDALLVGLPLIVWLRRHAW